MSSLHSDKGWLFVAIDLDPRRPRRQVRLYLRLKKKDTREKMRAGRLIIKEVETLIAARDWVELARRYPNNKGLAQFRPAFTVDATTFRQAAARFLEYQANANKPATVEFYKRIIETHITRAVAEEKTLPEGTPGEHRTPHDRDSESVSQQEGASPSRPTFADKPIRLIGASDIVALYAPVAQRGHLAQAQKIRRVLWTIFQWARGERGSDGDYLVGDNPVARTRPVGADTEQDGVNPFTSEEITAIIAGCRPGWERRLVIVAFEMGLRPNELFGLKRKDIEGAPALTEGRGQSRADNAPCVHIRQTYSRFGEGSVKTRGSRRSVPLSDASVRALREQLAEVELRSVWLWPARTRNENEKGRGLQRWAGNNATSTEERTPAALSGDSDLRTSGPSSPAQRSGPPTMDRSGAMPRNPQRFSAKNWPAILKRAGVQHRSFYQCRHTYAMRLLAEGVAMPEIAKRMGHTDLKMLFNHYLRWAPEKTGKKVRR